MTIKNNIKKAICNKWEQGKCVYGKDKCIFAHGKEDLVKRECLNGIKCYNEKCNYIHPEEWNAYNNKKECDFCQQGFCDKKNIRYIHINNDIGEIKNVNHNKKLDINRENILNDNEFPKLINNNNKIKDDILEFNDLSFIKKELYKEYKYLSKLDPDSWADDEDIEITNQKIKVLTDNYNKIKEKIKMEDIFNKELNLEILEIKNNDNKIQIKEDNLNIEKTLTYINNGDINQNPNVTVSINYNNIHDCLNDNILFIINKMEEENKKYISRIKNILDKDETINDEYKLYYKFQLNSFMKELYLLKNNYNDIFN